MASGRSRCVGVAGVEVQMGGRRIDVGSRTRDRLCCDRFPGDPGRRRLGLDRDLDLMDASVWARDREKTRKEPIGGYYYKTTRD